MAFVLPSKREAGVVMNSDLAQEWDGNKAVYSDGTEITFNPPPPRPVMPDWSTIKQIRHYFNRSYKNNFFPAWLYNHQNGESRIVKNANEAAELGVCYRARTASERERFGEGSVWDWEEESPWRPTPKAGPRTYDPRKPEQGKEYVASQIPQATANRDMLAAALPEITAAVVAAMRSEAPAKDPKQWEEFIAFQAWKKTKEAIDVVTEPEPTAGEIDVAAEHQNALDATMVLEGVPDEKSAWIAEAKNRGIKVDGRWTLDRIKLEVEKAS